MYKKLSQKEINELLEKVEGTLSQKEIISILNENDSSPPEKKKRVGRFR